jgi:50S ribosomal protein L16 3-hydroxylase
MLFQNFDIDLFLRDYWQKKPTLIRNPWQVWVNPLEPDELAGLACEAELESRLICRAGGDWSFEQGPLPEDRFATLPPKNWTLLVQAVDHHVPEVAALIRPFRFIPNWRIDDVMVSLAADEGGVGPHFDQYDVFLVQGLGRRRWQIGPICDADTPLLPHEDLKLLADFEATDEWVLEPGDILYVPPGFAHNGTAVGDDCMTYSIGFRAPSRAELLGHYVDDLLDMMSDDDRYGDPDFRAQANPGEITSEALARLQDMVVRAIGDRHSFARWFGAYNSTPKYADVDWAPEESASPEAVSAAIASGALFTRNPASRFAFIQGDAGALTLFVDGTAIDCAAAIAPLAHALCATDEVTVEAHFVNVPAAVALLTQLCNQGAIAFDSDA